MNHFINLKDIPAKDLRKIIIDAKKRKNLRKNLSTLEVDKGAPLKGKLLIQMFEKSSLRTRLSFYLAMKQLAGGTLTLRSNELPLGQGGESIDDTAKILSTSKVLKFFLRFFLFFASTIIFLRSLAGTFFKFIKCFILI